MFPFSLVDVKVIRLADRIKNWIDEREIPEHNWDSRKPQVRSTQITECLVNNCRGQFIIVQMIFNIILGLGDQI